MPPTPVPERTRFHTATYSPDANARCTCRTRARCEENDEFVAVPPGDRAAKIDEIPALAASASRRACAQVLYPTPSAGTAPASPFGNIAIAKQRRHIGTRRFGLGATRSRHRRRRSGRLPATHGKSRDDGRGERPDRRCPVRTCSGECVSQAWPRATRRWRCRKASTSSVRCRSARTRDHDRNRDDDVGMNRGRHVVYSTINRRRGRTRRRCRLPPHAPIPSIVVFGNARNQGRSMRV